MLTFICLSFYVFSLITPQYITCPGSEQPQTAVVSGLPSDSTEGRPQKERVWGSRAPLKGIYVGGCQNYGPFWGTLNIRRRTILGTQKGTIILTTIHMGSFKGIFQGTVSV